MAKRSNTKRGASEAGATPNRDREGSTPSPAASTVPPIDVSTELLADLGPLSTKQRRFVLEFLGTANGNATEAYCRAYQAERKVAESLASRLMGSAKVAAVIAKHRARQEKAAVLTIERLDRALEEVIEFDPRRLYRPVLEDGKPKLVEGRQVYEPIPLPEWPEDLAKSLAGVKVQELFEGASRERFQIGQLVEWKRHDRTAAIGLAYKRRGALVDKAELAVTGVKSVTVNIGVGKKKTDGKDRG